MKSHLLHQVTDPRGRKILLSRWTRRLLFLLGGLAVGAAAVTMAVVADEAYAIFTRIHESWPFVAYLLPPLGFGAITFVTIRFIPLAKGSGIPQVIAARRLKDPDLRRRFVSLGAAFGKIVLLGVGLLCGASIGREGPTIQVGAAIMLAFGRFSPRRQPGLLLAGSAAGVAAAFNAPLAGIVFGIEEMSRSFEVRTSGLILGTVIAAGLTSLAIVGHYAYFGHSTAILPIGPAWGAVVLAGVVCGLAGGLFSRILAFVARGVPGAFGGWMKAHPVLFAALCGAGVSFLGLLSGGSIFGTGYEEARAIIDGETGTSPLFGPLKLLATALSSISGIAGGLFSPSLAVGAGIGADIAWALPDVPVSTLAILCMAGYLSGVVQAPITSFVIVSEMTDNHALVLPIMLTCLISTGVSKLIIKEGIYQILADIFLASINKPEPPARSG